MLPTNQAQKDTIMNSVIVVRIAGTPTLRLAFSSPPTAKTQLPNRVRVRMYDAMAVKMIHQMMAM